MLKRNFSSALLHKGWQPIWKITIRLDTSVQKASISGFSGCLEIQPWYGIRFRLKKRSSSCCIPRPGQCFLICTACYPLDSLWVLLCSSDHHKTGQKLFSISEVFPHNIRVLSLEIGIMAGCTISPLAFTMAMEHVVIRGSKWVVGGERLQSRQRLSSIRAYMDNMTTLTTTFACTKRLLEKLQHKRGTDEV